MERVMASRIVLAMLFSLHGIGAMLEVSIDTNCSAVTGNVTVSRPGASNLSAEASCANGTYKFYRINEYTSSLPVSRNPGTSLCTYAELSFNNTVISTTVSSEKEGESASETYLLVCRQGDVRSRILTVCASLHHSNVTSPISQPASSFDVVKERRKRKPHVNSSTQKMTTTNTLSTTTTVLSLKQTDYIWIFTFVGIGFVAIFALYLAAPLIVSTGSACCRKGQTDIEMVLKSS